MSRMWEARQGMRRMKSRTILVHWQKILKRCAIKFSEPEGSANLRVVPLVSETPNHAAAISVKYPARTDRTDIGQGADMN